MNIEKGIPIPPSQGGRENENVKLLMAMSDGDSVLMKDQREFVNFYQAAKRKHIKITSRRQAGGMVRVWRIGNKSEANP